jgi:hypothetical protein
MDGECYYLLLSAVQNLTKNHPVILFFDGHHSHLTLDLIELARQHLICFPPQCTQLATCAAVVDKEDFPPLLFMLWDIAFLPPTSYKLVSPIPAHKLSKADPVNK